jgi:hypothetical protein
VACNFISSRLARLSRTSSSSNFLPLEEPHNALDTLAKCIADLDVLPDPFRQLISDGRLSVSLVDKDKDGIVVGVSDGSSFKRKGEWRKRRKEEGGFEGKGEGRKDEMIRMRYHQSKEWVLGRNPYR